MTSATLNQELDSSFLKGLRLLHSSEPDAEEQLQQLWKQAVVDKYGSERSPTSVLHRIAEPETVTVKRGNQDVPNDAVCEVKRPKLESPALPPPASTSPQRSIFVSDDLKDSSGDEASPLEILNTNNVCKKCKTSISSVDDKLVECVDCHKHYHQKCHFPPISDMDLSDPRFVWYCSSCDQNITTNTIDKTKSNSSNTNSIKSGNSTKGQAASSKSGRIHSTNNKSSAQGNTTSTHIRTTESNSKDTGSSNSSSTSEIKGHMMKKRSMKKPDRKKSSK